MWLDTRSYQGSDSVSAFPMLLCICFDSSWGELGLPCPRVQPWRCWNLGRTV